MNPAEATAIKKPNMFKNIVKKTGGALGIQVAPVMEQATVVSDPGFSAVPAKSIDFNAVKPQVDLAQSAVPPAVENAFQNAPQGALDPTKPAPQETASFEPAASVVPPAQPHIAEFTPSPVPDQKSEVVESAPVEPVAAPLSADISKPEASNEIPEDPVATELIDSNPELFIKNGALDLQALKAAKEAKLIAENPKAQSLVNQLHEAGVVNPDVVSRLVQPILSETQKAA